VTDWDDHFGFARTPEEREELNAAAHAIAAGRERIEFDHRGELPSKNGQHDQGGEDPKRAKPRARRRSWAEFRQQPEFRWRMRGWLPTQGVAVLAGAEHTGKSILATDWGVRCVLGDAVPPWCGHEVRHPCSSLYIIGEDAQGVQLRVEAFVRERVGGSFSAQFLESLTCEGRTIEFVDRFLDPLAQPVGITEVQLLIEAFRDDHGHLPGIVFLDTSSTLYGGDENENAEYARFVSELDRLADEFELLFLLIDHLRKPSTIKAPSRPSGADLRGASTKGGNMGTVVFVWRKDPDDRLAPVEVFIHKGKNGGNTGTAHWLQSRWIVTGKNIDGDEIGAPILAPVDRPVEESAEDRQRAEHDAASANVVRIAFRMLAALRAPNSVGFALNQTDGEDLTHGKGKDKRAAWKLLVKNGWIANTGTAREERWTVTDDAPPSHDPRFGSGDTP